MEVGPSSTIFNSEFVAVARGRRVSEVDVLWIRERIRYEDYCVLLAAAATPSGTRCS